ncbi:MAG: type III pantothenate kinase [Gemmataceae bacterium]|nr:type III pantothenate kinase [Gemmataceae bacterium]MDW8264262.1 type III pantothenate kinase [Gemmataceae bacterium]
MIPDVVADVGNSRIKWGRCRDDRIAAVAALPHDEPTAWGRQLEIDDWRAAQPLTWAVSGVAPRVVNRLVAWLEERGDRVVRIERAAQLPLRVELERPDHVGIDRLLKAVAVNDWLARQPGPRPPAIIVDAGTAITVDLVDETGAFQGGSILPGLRLAARALHEHTALLPLVELPPEVPPLPGKSTPAALQAGLYHGLAGAVDRLIARLAAGCVRPPAVVLAGGDGPRLHQALERPAILMPLLTLEGLRLTAQRLVGGPS